jgi:hypothetical protein
MKQFLKSILKKMFLIHYQKIGRKSNFDSGGLIYLRPPYGGLEKLVLLQYSIAIMSTFHFIKVHFPANADI